MSQRDVLRLGLRQPDARSCGASCVVVARRLLGSSAPPTGTAPAAPAAPPAPSAQAAFAVETLATHVELTRLRGPGGRWQVPWPRALGTPPWAVARALTLATGVAHRTRVVRRVSRTGGTPPSAGALYVGSRWLPRHVVLVVDADPPQCYEPASGQVLPLDGRPLAGWRYRWFAVTPTVRRTRA